MVTAQQTDECETDSGYSDLGGPATCGNGVRESGETCDDDNTVGGDGCNASCAVETGWTCQGQPSVCRCVDGSQDHDHNGACSPACATPTTTGVACSFQGCDDSTGTAACTGCVVFVDGAAAGGTGSAWSTAQRSIPAALAAAVARLGTGTPWCDVWVRQGTYYIFDTAVTDTIQLLSNVRLSGGFAGGETSLSQRDIAPRPTILNGEKSGAPASRVTHVVTAASNVALDGFIVTRGWADGFGGSGEPREYGGGFYAKDLANVVISNCVFADNHAGWAGGVYLSVVSNLLFEDSWVVNNVVPAGNGGGMIINGVSGLFRNVKAIGNQSGYGGGAAYYQGSNNLVFESCAFVANRANASGGAFALSQDARPLFLGSVFAANHAGTNGGAMSGNGTTSPTRPEYASSAFIGNVATGGNGGAIYNQAQSLSTVRNCTFAYNESNYWGGAIANEEDGGDVTVTNSVFWNNFGYAQVNHALSLAGAGVDTYVRLQHTVISQEAAWCQGTCSRQTGVVDADPGFASIAGSTPGSWAAIAVESWRRTSTLTANGNPGWAAGALVHSFVQPDTTARYQYPIIDNTADTLVVLGDVTAPNSSVATGDAFEIFSYELGGDSPCLDTGLHYVDDTMDAAGQPRPVCLLGWDPGCFDLGAFERQRDP